MTRKNERRTLFVAFAFLFILAYPVLADQCLTSIDASTSVATNVTTGTSVQISATPSGSCSSGEVTLQIIYSNCSLTVTDPPSPGYYTGVSTGTAKTFTVTSGSAGICTITARGTTSDGSVDSNTPVILEFVDPAALTTAGTNAASATFSSTFNLGINISNPQASDTLTSYTLTLPTGLTRTSGDVLVNPSITVSGGGVKPLSWVITHSTCFTGTQTVTLQIGDSTNAFSTSVTGNSSCGSGGSGSGSGSNSGAGAGSNSTNTVNESKLFSTTAGTAVILPFTTITGPGITAMEIKTTNAVGGISIALAAAIKPSAAPEIVTSTSGKVYSYADITSNQDNSVFSSIKIKFKVPSSWISVNNIDHTKTYMYRWANGNWNRLDTQFKSNDTNNYFFEATTPGFSTFAIAGFKANATVPENPVTPAVTFISPTEGLIVRNSTVLVQLSASGITLAEPKTTLVAGEGHFKVLLDDANAQTGSSTMFTFANVSEGSHTLKAELLTSTGASFSPPVVSTITFTVENPLNQQAAGAPFVMPDITIIGIIIVILVVVVAGGYFMFMHHGKVSGPRTTRRPFRMNFSNITSRISSLIPKGKGGNDDRSFSGAYEYRGEGSYSVYNPDTVSSPSSASSASPAVSGPAGIATTNAVDENSAD